MCCFVGADWKGGGAKVKPICSHNSQFATASAAGLSPLHPRCFLDSFSDCMFIYFHSGWRFSLFYACRGCWLPNNTEKNTNKKSQITRSGDGARNRCKKSLPALTTTPTHGLPHHGVRVSSSESLPHSPPPYGVSRFSFTLHFGGFYTFHKKKLSIFGIF